MARPTTLSDLEKVFKRFTLQELLDDVLPNLPGVSWPAIKKALLKELNEFHMKTVAKFILQTKAMQNMDQNTLNEMIALVNLIEISHHSSRFTWNAYKLMGCSKDSPMDNHDIETALIRQCRLSGLHAIVKVITFKNLHWASITLKKIVRGSGQRLQRPLIFAYTRGYLFLNTPTAQEKLMQAVKSALQYKAVRKAKLSGKHIESLLKCFKIKEQHALERKADYNTPAGTYKKNGSNFDFAQNDHRKKYADYVFGKDPPILEELTISTKDSPWKGPKIVDGSHNKIVNSTVVYHSNNVYGMLKKMIELQALTLPLPEFFKQIVTSGKNEIQIKTIAH